MKFLIERSALMRALSHVQSVVERRNAMPILSNVRIDVTGETLSLLATDMDLQVVEAVSADVSEPGSTSAPAHTLFEIVRKLPDGSQIEVSYTSDDGQLTLVSGRSRFALACLPVEDFPVMSGGDFTHTFAVSAADLRALIERTRFAISTEEQRYYLNGIFVHAAQSEGLDVLRGVATDGHRLARVELPLPDGAAGMPGIIVPRKAVGELTRLLEETGMDVTVSLSETKIRFAFDDVVLTSKLIDGTFPDYERVIPTGNDKVMEAERRALYQAVDRVSAISSEKSKSIKLAIETGQLTLSASSPEAGSAVEEVEAAYDAPPVEIGFNSRYLLDIVSQIDGDAARFTLADASSPTVIRDVADGSAIYVLMPMRV